ncbi:hypothetical protein NL676_020820 [Syzygium grande]|nr:hypothetical protein NL676_020820 [Syzygium grande]
MGCGKSKHDVATGNTITKSRSSGANPEKSKQVEQNVPRMEAIGNDAALLVQQEINNVVSQDTGTATDLKDVTEHPEPEREEESKEEETKAEDEDGEEEKHAEEERVIELERELEPETEPVAEEEEAETGRFTSCDSPDHYFSREETRKHWKGSCPRGSPPSTTLHGMNWSRRASTVKWWWKIRVQLDWKRQRN